MGILQEFWNEATSNFFTALKSSKRWFNLTSQAPCVLLQSTMMNFVLLPVAESTQLQNEQTESKKVQLEHLDLTSYVEKYSENVQLNFDGLRSETLAVSRRTGALLRLL